MEKVTHRLLESVVSALYVDGLPCGTEEWGNTVGFETLQFNFKSEYR